MKKLLMGFLILGLCLNFVGCNGPKGPLAFTAKTSGTAELVDEDALEIDKNYLAIKAKLFKPSCIQCHNAETAIKKKRLDLTKKSLIIENYDDILYRMTDQWDLGFDYMPPKGDQIPATIIKEFSDWKTNLESIN
jgi:mono/diheme cytochrome c family protein